MSDQPKGMSIRIKRDIVQESHEPPREITVNRSGSGDGSAWMWALLIFVALFFLLMITNNENAWKEHNQRVIDKHQSAPVR